MENNDFLMQIFDWFWQRYFEWKSRRYLRKAGRVVSRHYRPRSRR